jgi:hypothetical protein
MGNLGSQDEICAWYSRRKVGCWRMEVQKTHASAWLIKRCSCLYLSTTANIVLETHGRQVPDCFFFSSAVTTSGSQMKNPIAKFKVFKGSWSSWETLFGDAANFASQIGPDRLISISHSADHAEGVVTVWYWEG